MLIKNKMRALVCGLMLAATLGTATATQAATIYPPEGGQWNYGVGVLGSYSDYLHPSNYHGSTVNYNGTKYQASAPAGQWSQALARGIYSGCSFYYNL